MAMRAGLIREKSWTARSYIGVGVADAVLIMRGADEAEVLAIIEADVYTAGGVWHDATIVGYGRVVSEG